MEVKKRLEKVHHGHNIRALRNGTNMTQKELGDRLNISQSKICDLECEPTISDDELERFAEFFGVPLNFFKKFNLSDAAKHYSTTNNESENISVGEGVQNINYYPLDTVKELYEKIIQMKDIEIESLRKQISLQNKDIKE